QRRLLDLGAAEVRRRLPVAIEVAVPVEAAAEAGLLEGAGEDLEVLGGQVGAGRGIGHAVEQATLVRAEDTRRLRRLQERFESGAVGALIEAAQGAAGIAIELGLGDARLLEIEDVVKVALRH